MKGLIQCQESAVEMLSAFLKTMPEIRVENIDNSIFDNIEDEREYICSSFANYMDATFPEISEFTINLDEKGDQPSLAVSHLDNTVKLSPLADDALAVEVSDRVGIVNKLVLKHPIPPFMASVPAELLFDEGIGSKLNNYVASGGGYCPSCGGKDLETTLQYVDVNKAAQEVLCLSCDFKWLDLYTLRGAQIHYGNQ